MQRILILASGNGTNAENLIRYFAHSDEARVGLVLCDRPGAKVLERAKSLNVATLIVARGDLASPQTLATIMAQGPFDLTVLAGFLGLIPAPLLAGLGHRVINLHPALLPKYGGKGMYGEHVHRAVIAAREPISGITIHWVNPLYDQGARIFQATCRVRADDTPERLAARIHTLEHYYLPRVCEALLTQAIDNPLGIQALSPPLA